MNDDSRKTIVRPGRRRVLKQAMAAGAALVAAPYVIRQASAQAADLGPYQGAKINWRQVEGEQITVAVIPASYFDNLIELAPQFEALTGIKVRFEKVPPGQIRQKAMLDLSSKTATYATSATDPMYYPLYVSNKWVDPLDKYLNDPAMTDAAWFNYNDIIKAWRDADSMDGKVCRSGRLEPGRLRQLDRVRPAGRQDQRVPAGQDLVEPVAAVNDRRGVPEEGDGVVAVAPA